MVEVYPVPDFTKEIVGGSLGGLALLALLTAGLYKVRHCAYAVPAIFSSLLLLVIYFFCHVFIYNSLFCTLRLDFSRVNTRKWWMTLQKKQEIQGLMETNPHQNKISCCPTGWFQIPYIHTLNLLIAADHKKTKTCTLWQRLISKHWFRSQVKNGWEQLSHIRDIQDFVVTSELRCQVL